VPIEPGQIPDLEGLACSSHMYRFMHPTILRIYINLAKKALAAYDFDSIAFRGMSGALIAPSVALALNKQLLMVRKPHDDSHSTMKVEGYRSTKRYVILDDFVSSGATANTIKARIEEFAPSAECLGVLCVMNLTYQRFRELAEGQRVPLWNRFDLDWDT
jgi:adenine/guanine phosphoribosyltransferase-like PRPP-binding protein